MADTKPKITSGELANIWEQYMNNSLASVVLDHYERTLKGTDIKSVCAFALQSAQMQTTALSSLMNQENFPLPKGYSSGHDLNPNAPKMVTDEFVLQHLNHMAKMDVALTSMRYTDSVREDVRQLFKKHLDRATELYEMSASLLLNKGLFVRPPIITTTHESETVAGGSFLSNFFGAGDKRPLTACEANQLHRNVLMNYMGKSLMMALHQSNDNEKMQRLLLRGKELAAKIMNEFSSVLIQNDLPAATASDTNVLDSKVSPFSNRLITSLVDLMNKFGIANYGYGAAVSDRKDLKAMYARIIMDVYQYEEDIKQHMIENEWLEMPPVAIDRAKVSTV